MKLGNAIFLAPLSLLTFHLGDFSWALQQSALIGFSRREKYLNKSNILASINKRDSNNFHLNKKSSDGIPWTTIQIGEKGR
jgi:hypothetical protein